MHYVLGELGNRNRTRRQDRERLLSSGYGIVMTLTKRGLGCHVTPDTHAARSQIRADHGLVPASLPVDGLHRMPQSKPLNDVPQLQHENPPRHAANTTSCGVSGSAWSH
jgi:hypothetical protein